MRTAISPRLAIKTRLNMLPPRRSAPLALLRANRRRPAVPVGCSRRLRASPPRGVLHWLALCQSFDAVDADELLPVFDGLAGGHQDSPDHAVDRGHYRVRHA